MARTPAETHRMVWDIGVMGKDIIIDRCRKHGIDPDLRFGYLYAALHGRHMRELTEMKAEWEDWGYGELEFAPDKGIAQTPYQYRCLCWRQRPWLGSFAAA